MQIDKLFIQQLLNRQHFDCCAISSIDFKNQVYETVEVNPWNTALYYDLASLTKPLTLASFYLKNESIFDEQLKLLLNHQAGFISGGRLSLHNWRQQILSYPIKRSDTCYSDFSALRLQLEIEQRTKCSLERLSSFFWDQDLLHWKHLRGRPTPITGIRENLPIQGVVHDDNAFILNCFTAHAGLFATVEGLTKSLLNLDREVNLLLEMTNALKNSSDRFVNGWDRVEDQKKTLAGQRASLLTFGHLGFTGTSIWIDVERQQGIVILTNATQNYWYSRNGLNNLRRIVADKLWI